MYNIFQKNEKILVLKKKYRSGSQIKSSASDDGSSKDADEAASSRVRASSPDRASLESSISREASQDRLSSASSSDKTSPDRGASNEPELVPETPERSMVRCKPFVFHSLILHLQWNPF